MLSQQLVNIVYLFAAVLFILDLKMLAHPRTAVRGNKAGALGMALAIAATLLSDRFDWPFILLGIAIGSVIGTIAAVRVKMTTVPEMVGLFNGFGGGASVLVAGSALIAAVSSLSVDAGRQMTIATVASGIIGSVTFFGSYVAFGKLAEFLCVTWKLHTWQKVVKYGFSTVVAAAGLWYGIVSGFSPLSALLVVCALAISALLFLKKDRFPGMIAAKIVMALLALVCGVLVVLFPGNTHLFWVLVGASGVILTNIMCKAMNRSLANVLFGTMGPIAGMPIIDVDYAKTVVVIKRSLSPGFAGIPNPLFALPNTLMFFNDGKKAMLELIAAVKEL